MRVKLFTHTDLDGIGCGIVAAYAFKDLDIEYCNYDEIDNKVSKFIKEESFKYDKVFITDISVSENVAKEIEEYIPQITKLIDHHATAKWLNKYSWASVNDLEPSFYSSEEQMKSSGTSLFYKYLLNNYSIKDISLIQFVEKVRRYDTWEWSTKFDDLHAKKLNDLLYIIGRDKFIERFKENPSIEFTKGEELILEVEQYKIEEYIAQKVKQLQVININGHKAGVVFAEQYSSQVGNELAKIFDVLDFIVLIDVANKKVSYRGIRDEIDLGKDIAKLFGGGGHPKAAGSQIDDEIVTNFINNVFAK